MLGDKIEARRKMLGISQKELAQRAGITEASLSRYINNARLPKTEYLKKIADALHTTTDFLLGKDDPTDYIVGYYYKGKYIKKTSYDFESTFFYEVNGFPYNTLSEAKAACDY